jgi:hypothetical protein
MKTTAVSFRRRLIPECSLEDGPELEALSGISLLECGVEKSAAAVEAPAMVRNWRREVEAASFGIIYLLFVSAARLDYIALTGARVIDKGDPSRRKSRRISCPSVRGFDR